jgi:hypothetical protein
MSTLLFTREAAGQIEPRVTETLLHIRQEGRIFCRKLGQFISCFLAAAVIALT